jgi:hypothetical protein
MPDPRLSLPPLSSNFVGSFHPAGRNQEIRPWLGLQVTDLHARISMSRVMDKFAVTDVHSGVRDVIR